MKTHLTSAALMLTLTLAVGCGGDLRAVPGIDDDRSLDDEAQASGLSLPSNKGDTYNRTCGDGIRQWYEACDGTRFKYGDSCANLASNNYHFTGGKLTCRSDCKLDLSRCYRLSNNPAQMASHTYPSRPNLASAGNNVYLTWVEKRTVRGRLLQSDALLSQQPVPVTHGTIPWTFYTSPKPAVSSNMVDGWLVLWSLGGAQVSLAQHPASTPSAVDVSSVSNVQKPYTMSAYSNGARDVALGYAVSQGQGTYLAVYEIGDQLYYRLINATLADKPLKLLAGNNNKAELRNPTVASIGNRFMVAWQQDDKDGRGWYINTRIVGVNDWVGYAKTIRSTGNDLIDPAVTASGSYFVVAYASHSRSSSSKQVRVRAFFNDSGSLKYDLRVDSAGSSLVVADDVNVVSYSDASSSRGLLVTWSQRRSGGVSRDIVAQRVRLSTTGTMKLHGDAIIVDNTSGDQDAPVAARVTSSNGDVRLRLAWRSGTKILSQVLTPEG